MNADRAFAQLYLVLASEPASLWSRVHMLLIALSRSSSGTDKTGPGSSECRSRFRALFKYSCVCIIIAFKCVVQGPTDKYYKWSRDHHMWSVLSRSFFFLCGHQSFQECGPPPWSSSLCGPPGIQVCCPFTHRQLRQADTNLDCAFAQFFLSLHVGIRAFKSVVQGPTRQSPS